MITNYLFSGSKTKPRIAGTQKPVNELLILGKKGRLMAGNEQNARGLLINIFELMPCQDYLLAKPPFITRQDYGMSKRLGRNS